MLVYVAGKYRGDVDANILAARKIGIELWEKGYVAIVPHLNTTHFEVDCHVEDEVYLNGDLEILAKCDAIVMIPSWETSTGSIGERNFAIEHKIPVYIYPDLPEKI